MFKSSKKLIDENSAKVVVISSLQGMGTKNKRINLFNRLESLGIKVYDYIDPNFKGDLGGISLPSRVIGIVDYLKTNIECSYVILDDEYHNDYKLMCLNHFKLHPWKGLQEKDLSSIYFKKTNLRVLNKVNYYYRELGTYEYFTNKLISLLKKVRGKKI